MVHELCWLWIRNSLTLQKELRFPHSLGLLYSAFTYYSGFRVNSGEYKLMGLAPYGVPKFKQRILDHLVDLKADGSLWMDMSYFDYCQGLTMTNKKFDQLFGGKPRHPETMLTQREMDIAASVQAVTEEVMLRMAQYAHQLTGSKNLVLAVGGFKLCWQRPNPSRRSIRKNLDPASRGRCRWGTRYRFVHLASASEEP